MILNPFPFLFAKPIHCPSIGQMHYKRTRKDYEQTTSRDSTGAATSSGPVGLPAKSSRTAKRHRSTRTRRRSQRQ